MCWHAKQTLTNEMDEQLDFAQVAFSNGDVSGPDVLIWGLDKASEILKWPLFTSYENTS